MRPTPCILFFPEGSIRSLHFYGRSIAGGSVLSLLGAQEVIQNDCMYLGGTGETMFTLCLCQHSAGREFRVEGVLKTGGNLVSLHSTRLEGGEGEGGDVGGGGGQEEDSPPPASGLDFEPHECRVGLAAVGDAKKFFPEVVASAVAQRGEGVLQEDTEFLTVLGQLSVGAAAPPWRSLGDAHGMSSLLTRDFSRRDRSCEYGQGEGEEEGTPSTAAAAAAANHAHHHHSLGCGHGGGEGGGLGVWETAKKA